MGRQRAVNQQIGHFYKFAFCGQIGDIVAAIAQNAFFAVNKGDVAGAGAGVTEARIIGDQARLFA